MTARIHASSARIAPIRVLVLHGQRMLADLTAAALQAESRIQVVGIETDPAQAVDHARTLARRDRGTVRP